MLIETINDTESIYDLAIQTYGLDFIYKLIQENNLDSIEAVLVSGEKISWDETFNVTPSATLSQAPAVTPNPILMITAREGQTLYDVGIMTYGNLDTFYTLLQDSKIDSAEVSNIRGKVFTFDSRLIENFQLYKKRLASGYIINTGETVDRDASFDDSFDDSFDEN